MSTTANSLNKTGLRVLFGLCLLALVLAPALPCSAEGSFQVAPVQKASDLRLLPSAAWPPAESDRGEMLLKLSYLRGLLDALQYVEVSPQSAGRVLEKLKGMNLNELAAAIDRYYLKDPKRRELPPAAVLLRIIPEQK